MPTIFLGGGDKLKPYAWKKEEPANEETGPFPFISRNAWVYIMRACAFTVPLYPANSISLVMLIAFFGFIAVTAFKLTFGLRYLKGS